MSDDVICDICNKRARRVSLKHCPPDWFYGETVVTDHDERAGLSRVVVLACSLTCAHRFWVTGPGNLLRSPQYINDQLKSIDDAVKEVAPGYKTSWRTRTLFRLYVRLLSSNRMVTQKLLSKLMSIHEGYLDKVREIKKKTESVPAPAGREEKNGHEESRKEDSTRPRSQEGGGQEGSPKEGSAQEGGEGGGG